MRSVDSRPLASTPPGPTDQMLHRRYRQGPNFHGELAPPAGNIGLQRRFADTAGGAANVSVVEIGMRITVPVAAFAVLVVALGPRVTGGTGTPPGSSLAFVSEFGDPIGQGSTRSFHTITAERLGSNGLRALVNGDSGSPHFELMLRAPEGQGLRPGVYLVDAASDTNGPHMHFAGEGRSCSWIEGRFEIESIRFGTNGQVEHLRANFEQRCGAESATLWGELTVDAPGATRPARRS